MDYRAFGKRLQKIRNERGLTAEKLAELCNVSSVFLRNIEGGTKKPSLDTFIVLCDKLGVSPNCLLPELSTDDKDSAEYAICERVKSLSPSEQKLFSDLLDSILKNI